MLDLTIKGTLTDEQERGLAFRIGLETTPNLVGMAVEDALWALLAAQCDGFALAATLAKEAGYLEDFRKADPVKQAQAADILKAAG